MFGPYWDGETTLAEREWVDSHLASCVECRNEYESMARTLELAASLDRHEPAADLAERTLQRARRAAPVADRVVVREPRWVPVTAAAALLLVAATATLPWLMNRPAPGTIAAQVAEAPKEPVLVGTIAQPGATARTIADPASEAPSSELFADGSMAMVPDSLFDHSEDVEFILDPVVVNRRGRAAVSRTPGPIEARQAVITF
jgi:predicted anti-sigma-YlaC factor YlaD